MIIRWRENKRRHDDVHYPMQGRGRKATPPQGPKRARKDPEVKCPYCGGGERFAKSGACRECGIPVCQHPCMSAERDAQREER